MWQQYLQRTVPLAPFTFLSVAVDVDPERARPFAQGYSFRTVVDSSGVLGRTFDFDVVPNGLFVDEKGRVQYLHVGGFDIRREDIEQQVDALVRADYSSGGPSLGDHQERLDVEVLRTELAEQPENAGLHLALADLLMESGNLRGAENSYRRAAALDPADWSAPFGLGSLLYRNGDSTGALASWRTALDRDPANFTVRKQIWMVEHPEKFYPEIDFEWQREQLSKETPAVPK